MSRSTLDANRIALQTIVPASALNDDELAAAARGSANYTGYSCVIAPIGCACEAPVIQAAAFNFTPDNRLIYDYTVQGGTPAQWQLDHSGFNKWSYTTPITTSGGHAATFLALLSFRPEGYTITQEAIFSSGEVAACKDIEFNRIDAPVLTATP